MYTSRNFDPNAHQHAIHNSFPCQPFISCNALQLSALVYLTLQHKKTTTEPEKTDHSTKSEYDF